MASKKEEPAREQYKTLISLLEERCEIQDKTIAALEKQIEVLQEMLKRVEEQLRKKEPNVRGYYLP